MSDTGFADGFADGDGDVRVRPVAPRRAATAGAGAGRAAPRSRAAELAFTNLIHVKAISRSCGRTEDSPKAQYSFNGVSRQGITSCIRACIFLAAGTLCEHSARAGALAQSVL